MGTIQIDGSTPKLTIGNATAEDATILFDGNAQDFYIALDDSADDLLIGLGSTVGTTPIIAIDENKLSTFSGAITVGVDDTGHDVKLFGATAGSFLLWDESANALLLTDSTPIQIGDAQDLTLYHDGSNSYITNKTGALKVATETSGIAITIGHTTSEVTIADNLTVTGTVTLADGSLALADLDIDGGTDIGAAIVDADLFIIDDGAGGTNRKTVASRLKTYIGDNTPAFDAYMNGAQSVSDNAVTKVSIDTEIFDSDGCYDNSTNYRFTPAVAGKYYVYGSILGQTDASQLKNIVAIIYKNGSVYRTSNHDPRNNYGNEASVMVSAIIDMDADDYVELYGQCNANNDTNTVFAVSHTRPCYFGAFKVLGA